MNTIQVSVIIPNYNHALYLPERIESVLNQTYQNFEVIILDDCSTDNSKEIIEQYRHHPKISYIIYNETNSGSTFKQWKKGLTLAKGDYIWIAESDDYADAMFLEKLIPAFLNESIVLSYCRTYNVFDKKINIASWGEEIEPKLWNNSQVFYGKKFIHNFLRFRNVIPNASAVVFRKSFAEITEDIVNMRFAGDWLFWLKLAIKGDIAYYGEPLNYFRQHNNTTRSVKSYNYEKARVKEYIYTIKSANKTIFWAFNKQYKWLFLNWLYHVKTYSFYRKINPPYPFFLFLRFILFLLHRSYPVYLQKIKQKLKIRTRIKRFFGIS